MLMNFTCYGNRIKLKGEVVVTFQEIRKIKYSLNATTSFYQICCIVCRSEMKLDLLRRRCFNMADGVSMFDHMWLSLINQRVLDLLLLLYSSVKLNHSAQNRLSSSLLSRNLKIKISRTIILPVVVYGCENWSLISREKCRLRVFENRVLRRILWS